MKIFVALAIASSAMAVANAAEPAAGVSREGAVGAPQSAPAAFTPTTVESSGTVEVEGRRISYETVAGTIIVHQKGWDDSATQQAGRKAIGTPDGPPVASIFYVAYFMKGANPNRRPVTFLYNGGPGSSSVWLHMGAFGPTRVVLGENVHTAPAPYSLVNNSYSLLDASDLVFIDAPGTGFSRIEGKNKSRAFYGVDQDAYAFSTFITQFLSKYNRWNSPKYLYGESYGTTRSPVIVNELESERNIDFNGVILQSQALNFASIVEGNPGVDLPYVLELPTYAAAAWHYHKLGSNPPQLVPFLAQVEHFALGEYAHALGQGLALSPAERNIVAAKLHDFIGLPAEYIERANLRVSGAEFRQNLLADAGLITGRLDTRFSGPTTDPLSEGADYDPTGEAMASACVSAFNSYAHLVLHYDSSLIYNPGSSTDIAEVWDTKHAAPGRELEFPVAVNVLPDLGQAMKRNPDLRVMVNSGYFDLATPYFEAVYEMEHLNIPIDMESHIEFDRYWSGHMIYDNKSSLRQLHDNVARFIAKTDHDLRPQS